MSFNCGPIRDVGVGLRAQHYSAIFETLPPVPWFEALTENYLGEKALPLYQLLKIRENYPLTLHGVSLSIGSTDPLNWDYLRELKKLNTLIEPAWISDHLCWTSLEGRYIPDLLPMPHTQQAINHIAERVRQVQDFLGQQILLENVSRYLSFEHSEISEWEFLNEVANRADCYVLLDLNNIYVNAINHGFSQFTYLENISQTRVKQFHLAGFEEMKTHLIDSHSKEVSPPVWELYQKALTQLGPIPTLIEWDSELPSFEGLWAQAKIAQNYMVKSQNGV